MMFCIKITLTLLLLWRKFELNDGAVNMSVPTTTPHSIVLPEDTVLNHDVVKIVVNKPNTNAITWSLSGADSAFFKITPATGNDKEAKVTLVKALDYETAKLISVTVNIEHDGSTLLYQIYVIVTDVNDNAPDCGGSLFAEKKDENYNGLIKTLTCSDKDSGSNGKMSCSVGDARFRSTFADSKCEITLLSAIDFETLKTNPIILDVTVTDKATETAKRRQTIIQIVILITNIFDVPPSFVKNPVTCQFKEERKDKCVTIDVVDQEVSHSPPDVITCTLEGPDADKYLIESPMCYITPKVSIDREDPAAMVKQNLSITATDKGNNTVTVPVNVEILDMNDHAPECGPTTVRITKNELYRGELHFIICTDKDIGKNAQFECTATDTKIEAAYSDDKCTVQLKNPMDRETMVDNPFKFNVTVNDIAEKWTSKQNTSISFELTITDVNDNPPSCSNSTLSETKSESFTGVVFNASCTDPDEGMNSQLTCSTKETKVVAAMSGSNCVTQINNKIDYDTLTPSTFSFEVLVHDNAVSEKKTTTITYTITITDVFDVAPVFTKNQYICFLREETTDTCTMISVSDVETSHTPADDINCTLSGTNSDKFNVSSPSCHITLKTIIDRDVPGMNTTYAELTVVATDKGSNKATATVSVDLIDVNDNAPDCSLKDILVTKSETYAGALTGLSCSDKDAGVNAVVNCSTTESRIVVNSTSCSVSLASPIDRDTLTTNPIQFDVLAMDSPVSFASRKTTTVSYTLSITDVNDNAPTCTSPYLNASKSEMFTGVVFNASCTDLDEGVNSQLTCSTTEMKVVAAMSGSNCVTRINNKIDYETLTPSTFSFEVLVRDNAVSANKTTTLTYTITITGVDDNPITWGTWVPPYTDDTTVIKTIQELAAINTKLFTVVATDADKGFGGNITYSIISAVSNTGENLLSKFKIHSSTGIVSVASADLDREKYGTVVITVSASDGNNTLSRATKIAITNINDEKPRFTPVDGNYSKTINETAAIVGATVIQIVITDPDITPASISCNIVSGDTNSRFEMVTGYVIKLTKKLNIDKPISDPTRYELKVECSDGLLKSNATIVITIAENSNDFAPVVTNADQNFTLAENKAPGEIASFEASDNDYGTAGTLKYSLIETSSLFATNGSKLNLISSLDYETTKRHVVKIKIEDSFTNNPKSVTATATIDVTNINDNEPNCTNTTDVISILESTAVNKKQYTVPCSDADEIPAPGRINITAGDPTDRFYIDGVADLKLRKLLDYENTNQYVLTIRYTESAAPKRFATMNLTVNVEPVNEATPFCNPLSTLVTIPESTIINSNIGSPLSVIDSDKGNDSVIVYSVKTHADTFTVNSAGQLKLQRMIDYETMGASKVLSVEIEVKDQGSLPKSSTCTVAVTVTDVNEHAPVCTTEWFMSTIPENIGNDSTLIGANITATDADEKPPHNVLQYSIVDGDTTGSFVINATSGQIKVKSTIPTAINYEVAQSYNLKVKAQDSGGFGNKSVICNLNISVTDINEGTPTFATGNEIKSVLENIPTGTVVFSQKANDTDTLQTHTYSISPSTHFQVDSLGKVSLTSALDFETKTEHILKIKAVDNGASPSFLTGTYTLTVSVKDYNEGTPTFETTEKTINLPEDTATNTVVYNQTASDTDKSQTQTYYISPSTHFQVDSLGKVSLKAALDYEAKTQHILTIKAVDNGAYPGPLTGTYTVTALVSDVNEFNPNCSVAPSIGTIKEKAAVDTLVGTFNCIDRDSTSTLTYHINMDPFKMNGNQLKLANASVLDYDKGTRQYIILVEVKDEAILPKKTATVNYTVNVIFENDHHPEFKLPHLVIRVPESLKVQELVGTVTATDDDKGANHGALVYSIVSGNTAGIFSLNSANGKVILAKSVDFETDVKMYSLVIRATDGDGKFSVAYVTVIFTDINDNAPKFKQDFYSMEIAYDVKNNYIIGSVSALDPDSQLNGFIEYTWKESVPNFDLDKSTGSITKKTSAVLTPGVSFVYHVIATDNGIPKKSSETIVRIDTFEPILHAIAITISVENFDKMLPTILIRLAETLQTKYPQCQVKHMHKVQSNLDSSNNRLRSTNNVSPSTSTKSYYYVVKDDSAKSVVGLDMVKGFVPVSELHSLWRSDINGNPKPILKSKKFGNITIMRIEAYVPVGVTTQTPAPSSPEDWFKSAIGIAVMTILCILLLIAIILVVYFCYIKKRRTATRKNSKESNQELKEDTSIESMMEVHII